MAATVAAAPARAGLRAVGRVLRVGLVAGRSACLRSGPVWLSVPLTGVAAAALTGPLAGLASLALSLPRLVAGRVARPGRIGRGSGDRPLSAHDPLLTRLALTALLTLSAAGRRVGRIARRRAVAPAGTGGSRRLPGTVRLVAGFGLLVPLRPAMTAGRRRTPSATATVPALGVAALSVAALLAGLTIAALAGIVTSLGRWRGGLADVGALAALGLTLGARSAVGWPAPAPVAAAGTLLGAALAAGGISDAPGVAR